jgi:glycosyltransferase involved in cell wall biosynthesis
MKIAYITSHPDMKGGGERLAYETALRIQKQDHEVRLFCNSMDENKAFREMLQIPYEVYPARKTMFGKFVAYFGLKAVKKIIEAAIAWDPDIIFLLMGYAYGDYFQQKTKIAIVPYVHYPETFQPYKSSLIRNVYRNILNIRQLEKSTFKRMPLILCNSKYTESMIKSLEPTANTKVVYPGVDHNKFYPTWKDSGFLYYHSRFQDMKNQLFIIDVVRDAYPLILSGSVSKPNRDYYQKVLTIAKRYGCKVLVNLEDSEYISLLQSCSIFLFPSRNEHFGIVPIEAMACGKAVIGHNSGGTIETLGETGYLCGDAPKEWKVHIDDLMKNPQLRESVGKKSYEFSKQFNWEKTTQEILEAFQSIIKLRKNKRG